MRFIAIILILVVLVVASAPIVSAELEKKPEIKVVAVPDCEDRTVFFLAYTGGLPDFGLVGPDQVVTSEQARYIGMTAIRDPDILKTYCGIVPEQEPKVNCKDHVVCYFGEGCFYGNSEMMMKYCNLGYGQNGWENIVQITATPTPVKHG